MESIKVLNLSAEQKTIILEMWNSRPTNPPSIVEMTKAAFPDLQKIDARTWQYRAVKEFIATRQLVVKTTDVIETKTLTPENKEFLLNNCDKMRVIEMAKTLWGDIEWNDTKIRDIHSFLREHPEKELFEAPEDAKQELEKYKPPRNRKQALERVNKYILDCISYDEAEKNTKTQKYLDSLITFTHMYRFMMLMNDFRREKDRGLFESSYIRYVWDKPDLTEEELDMICNLCLDIVYYTNGQEELEALKTYRDNSAEENGAAGFRQALTDAIADIRKSMDENHKRQAKAVENLQGKRNERIETKHKETGSLLPLIESWREEKQRERWLVLLKANEGNVRAEIQKMDTLDSIIAEVYGLDKDNF